MLVAGGLACGRTGLYVPPPPPSMIATDTGSGVDASDAAPDVGIDVAPDVMPDVPGEMPPTVTPQRPVSPLSTSTVSSHRPSFRWVLAAGTSGAGIDVCRDRACTTTVASMVVGGTSMQLSSPLDPGVYYWRLHGVAGAVVGSNVGVTWEFVVPRRDAPASTSWTRMIDGDGFDDIVVGSPDVETAYVYPGSAAGCTTTPQLITMTGVALFGQTVAGVGDLDRDGRDELVIGAPSANMGAGLVDLFMSTTGGIAGSPVALSVSAVRGEFGFALALRQRPQRAPTL